LTDNGIGESCRRLYEEVINYFESKTSYYYIQADGKSLVTFYVFKFITAIIGVTCYENGMFKAWGIYAEALPRLKERFGSDIYRVYEALLRLRFSSGPTAFLDDYDRIVVEHLFERGELEEEELAAYIAGLVVYLKSLIVWLDLLYEDADKIRDDEIEPPTPEFIHVMLKTMQDRIVEEAGEARD